MLAKFILLLSLITIISFGQSQDGCQHDKYAFRTTNANTPCVPYTAVKGNPLPTVSCVPLSKVGKVSTGLRLTWDLTAITPATVKTITDSTKTMFTTATNVISRYIKDLLTVIQEAGNNKFRYVPLATPVVCNGYSFQSTYVGIGTGIALSDLHIIVSADTVVDDPAIQDPVGVACNWLPVASYHQDRPNFGVIRFPLAEMTIIKAYTSIKSSYQKRIFNSLLHQVFHILGLSMSEVTYWHKWTPNGSLAYYDRADLLNEEVDEEVGTHYYLATPSVKDAAMHQFQQGFKNQEKWLGMKLENQGVQNANYIKETNFGSHWELTVSFGEIMNVWGYASNQQIPIVSQFTLAALQDTGYYTSVNFALAELLPWGAGKGINFLQYECNNANSWDKEFYETLNGDCDFYNLGPGTKHLPKIEVLQELLDVVPNNAFIDTSCSISFTSDADSCINDSVAHKYQFITFEQQGASSRCFQSNIVASKPVPHVWEGGNFYYNSADVIIPFEEFDVNESIESKCYNTFGGHNDNYGLFNKDLMESDFTFNIGKKVYDYTCKIDGEHYNWYGQQYYDQYAHYFIDDKKTNKILAEDIEQQTEYFSLEAHSKDLNLEVLYGSLSINAYSNFEFIVFAVGVECPNLCSLNGYCVRGTSGCICLDGFVGLDCSIVQATQQVVCTKDNKKMLDQVTGNCIPSPCPKGRYALGTTACLRCSYGCEVCTSSTVCTRCNKKFLMQNFQCVPACSNYYYDSIDAPGQCLPCPQITPVPVTTPVTPPYDCQYCFKIQDEACLKCYDRDESSCVV